MRHFLGLALSTCLLVACDPPLASRVPASRSPETRTAAEEPIGAPRPPAGAAPAPTAEGPPAPRCRVTVTDTEGCGPRDVEELIAPVRTRIEKCRGATGGKLAIRVRKAPAGKLKLDVEPGSSLDPTERQCVLEALSSLQADESSTAWAGLNVRPTGFTSLITIEW